MVRSSREKLPFQGRLFNQIRQFVVRADDGAALRGHSHAAQAIRVRGVLAQA